MTKIEVADCASSPCDARLGFGSFHNLDFGVHRTHLSCDHESSPHHPQVGERKQGLQLGGVLGQTPVADLGVAKLALDHPKRMFNLGADAGLGFFQLSHDLAHRVVRQGPALAGAHGDLPLNAVVLEFLAFVDALVARVGMHLCLVAVQQFVDRRQVVNVGGRACNGVHQPGVGVHTNVGLHAEEPLVALLGLVHLRVPLAAAVLGRTGGVDQGGIDGGTGPEHQPPRGEQLIDQLQHGGGQPVLFQQVPEAQDGALVGQALRTRINADERAIQGHVVQGLFHRRIGVPEPLLQEVNPQHQLAGKRRPTRRGFSQVVRLYQRHQLAPGHHPIHLFQKHPLARAFGGHFKPRRKAQLLHQVQALYRSPAKRELSHEVGFCR